MSLTQEQIEERLNYVCGSDAAVICGFSPYKNVIELWQEKVGHIPAKDISNNPYVKAGNLLESVVRAWFESETNLIVKESPKMHVCQLEGRGFMAANIDGFIESERAIFEAKTASSDKGWGESGTNEVPDHYLIQVAHYMAVLDCDKAYIAVLIRGVDFRYYVINRNLKLEDMLVKKEKQFWDCVVSKIPPEPKTGKELISLKGYTCNEESALANDEIQSCLNRLEQVNFQMSILEREKEQMSDRIKIFMGESDTLVNISGKISATWKGGKMSKRFDLETFKTQEPEKYDAYTKEYMQPRRFLIKK